MHLPCQRQRDCIVLGGAQFLRGFAVFVFLALIPSPKEEVGAQENVLRVIDALG